jgi:hypothetical protein
MLKTSFRKCLHAVILGPVLTTVEALCARATACMEEGCRMGAVYRERANSFFAFRDQNNCRRVYDALCGYCELTAPETAGCR